MRKEIPIEQVTDRFPDGEFTYWVASSHIEEYPDEPTRLQMIWDIIKDWFHSLFKK